MPQEVCPYEEEDLLAVSLGDSVEPAMQSHLDACSRCRERLEQLRGEATLLRQVARSENTTTPSGPGPAPPRPAQRVPAVIGKYFVVGKLGEGAQAVVYRAMHPELNKELVIKLSRAPVESSERDLLAREARVLADLEHPNLARVYDLDWHEGHAFLVMDYVRGVNLAEYALQEKPTPQQSAAIVAQLARAAAVAHQRGVIHQDIKPGNIVVDEFGRPRLLDFGLARLRDAWSDRAEQPSGGTLAFMAPEQARCETERVGRTSDVFALGAVLYYLLTGRPPFLDDARAGAQARAGRCDFDRAALHARGIPRRLAAICLRAMAPEPEARYPRAELLAEDLERALRPTRPAWPLAVAAVVLLLAAGAAWYFWPRPGPPMPPTGQPLVLALQRTEKGQEKIYTPATTAKLLALTPLRAGDRLELGCDVPRGAQAAMFLMDTLGVLEELAPLDVSPVGEFDRVRFVARGLWRLEGPPGTVLVFVCANRQQRPSYKEVQKLLEEVGKPPQRGVSSLPAPAPVDQVVFQLDREKLQTVGEDTRLLVETPYSRVRDLLERLRVRLRERFDYSCGVALPQR